MNKRLHPTAHKRYKAARRRYLNRGYKATSRQTLGELRQLLDDEKKKVHMLYHRAKDLQWLVCNLLEREDTLLTLLRSNEISAPFGALSLHQLGNLMEEIPAPSPARSRGTASSAPNTPLMGAAAASATRGAASGTAATSEATQTPATAALADPTLLPAAPASSTTTTAVATTTGTAETAAAAAATAGATGDAGQRGVGAGYSTTAASTPSAASSATQQGGSVHPRPLTAPGRILPQNDGDSVADPFGALADGFDDNGMLDFGDGRGDDDYYDESGS